MPLRQGLPLHEDLMFLLASLKVNLSSTQDCMFLRGIFCALTLRKTKLQVAGLLKVGMLKASQITAIKLLSKYDKSSRSDYSFDF